MKRFEFTKKILALVAGSFLFAACSDILVTDKNETNAGIEKDVKILLDFKEPESRATWAPDSLKVSDISSIVISTKEAEQSDYAQKLTASSAAELESKTIALSVNTSVKAAVTLNGSDYSGVSTYTGGSTLAITLSSESTEGKIYLDLKNVPAGKNKWVAIYKDSLPEVFEAASFYAANATKGYGKTTGDYQLAVVYSSDETLNLENIEGSAFETVKVEAGFTTNVTPEFQEGVVTIYTVIFNANYEGGENTTVRVASGKTAVAPELTRTGWTLKGWYTEALCINAAVLSNVTENKTFYAKWEEIAVPEVSKITVYNGITGTSKKGEYDTVKAALAACGSSGDFKIVLPKGTYNENGLTYNGSGTIRIAGDTSTKYGTDVVIKGHGSDMTTEKGRSLLAIGNGNFILENLTLESDWLRSDRPGVSEVQAEVLGYDGSGYVSANNCSFKSHQDTMRTTGKCWFYDCYIEGDVDFIWMEQAGKVALYEKCEIVSVYDSATSNHTSYVVAPRATKSSVMGKGVVIFDSILKVQANQTTYLFRNPWGTNSSYYNQAAFVNVTVDGSVNSKLAFSAASGTSNQQYVGWKIDSTLAGAYGSKDSTIGVLSSDVKSKEYSGRRAILNRNYNISDSQFEKDISNYWNIDEFISTVGWSVQTDDSKETLDGETVKTVTAWDFTKIASGTFTIQSKTGTVDSTTGTGTLAVDATNGKLAARGTDAQFNENTIVKIPASAGNEIEVVVYDKNYTLGATTATAGTTKITVTSSDITDGYVELKATGNTYLYSITLTGGNGSGTGNGGGETGGGEGTPVTVKWDWQNGIPSSITSTNIQEKTDTVASDVSGYELDVDATVSNGKLAYNSAGYSQFNSGTKIRVPVATAGDKITVVSYPGQANYTIGGAAAAGDTSSYTATSADVTAGYVEIIATSTAYIYSITLVTTPAGGTTPPAPEVSSVSVSGTNSIAAEGNTTLTAAVTMSDSSEYSGTISWTIVSGGDYAELSTTTGKTVTLTGKNATSTSQTVTVKATAGGKEGSYSVTVGAKASAGGSPVDWMWSPADYDAKEYSAETKLGNVTFVADSSKTLTIEANSKTLDNVTYASRVKTNGTGTKTGRALKFTLASAATVTVYAYTGTAGRPVVLEDPNGNKEQSALTTSLAAYEFTCDIAGDYYLYSGNSGIYISALKVEYGTSAVKPTAISLNKTELNSDLAESTSNTTATLTATLTPSTGISEGWDEITWSTSNDSVASISATSGASVTVTYGATKGTAKITATTKNNLSAVCNVSVVDSSEPVPANVIKAGDSAIGFASSGTYTTTVTAAAKGSYSNPVTTSAELKTAVSKGGVIYIKGMIDMTDTGSGSMLPTVSGDSYVYPAALDAFVSANTSYASYSAWKNDYISQCETSTNDEGYSLCSIKSLYDAYKKQIQLNLKSDTTLIGLDGNSGLRGGTISISNVSNVSVRNLTILDAYDPFPHHEDDDGWNSQYDCVVAQGTNSNVWIDHCTFGDTMSGSDSKMDYVINASGKKEHWNPYDGLCDIKGTQNGITVSYCKFEDHDKALLFCSGTSDTGTKNITLAYNYFAGCKQRLPMVGIANLHEFNNYFAIGNGLYTSDYAIGLRYSAQVVSENNYFTNWTYYSYKDQGIKSISGQPTAKLYKSGDSDNSIKKSNIGSSYITENINDLFAIDYSYDLKEATDLPEYIPSNAGAGKWTVQQ